MSVNLPRRTSWFVTLPIAVTTIGFLWIIFFPTARSIRETRNEIRLKQEFIQQTATLHSSVDLSEQQLNEMELYRREREDGMSLTSQLATLFGRINARARESGSTTTHFDPQAAKSMDLLQRVPVRMDVVGSFPEVCQLLAELEKMPETIWVDQLTLKRPQESGKNIEGELKLEVFTINSKKSG